MASSSLLGPQSYSSIPGIAKFERVLDKLVPAASTKCNLVDCTAGKVYLVIAALSLAASTSSWLSFITTLVWQLVLGLIISWLCRTCRNRWIWGAIILAALVPLVFVIMFAIGVIELIHTANNS